VTKVKRRCPTCRRVVAIFQEPIEEPPRWRFSYHAMLPLREGAFFCDRSGSDTAPPQQKKFEFA